MKFFAEIFQDIDGSFSAKRTVLFVFVLLFVALTVAVYFHQVGKDALGFIQGALDKITDLIKWMGGFVAAEQATKFRPITQPPSTLTVVNPEKP